MGAIASPFATSFGSGFSFVPPSGAGGTPLGSLGATDAGDPGQLDMLIDPATLDYVRTANGEWAETADSRTLMMIMLELELGASPFDPNDGTTIGARRRDGDPVTPEEVEAEVLRIGDILTKSGTIAELQVAVRDADGNVLLDGAGRFVVALSWRDLASGSPVDLAISG